jgi:hypothetical protein
VVARSSLISRWGIQARSEDAAHVVRRSRQAHESGAGHEVSGPTCSLGTNSCGSPSLSAGSRAARPGFASLPDRHLRIAPGRAGMTLWDGVLSQVVPWTET